MRAAAKKLESLGLMFVAKHWQEATLYRAAHAFEEATDWKTMGPAKQKKTRG